MPTTRILYVEDDEDVRDTMTMLLEHEGYQVTAVPRATRALDELARARFDLLLTDYRLPDHPAPWLIRRAEEQGCLGTTPILVLTAEDHPQGLDGHRCLRKPVSQEALLAAFDRVMAPRGAPAAAAVPREAALRLVLYVSGEAHSSQRARRNLRRVLDGVAEDAVEVVVHDVGGTDRAWEASTEADRIVVLPTLVRHAPAPKLWIAGDLSEVERVREAILPPALAGLR
jgi:CheY-like chemotaxis protein